MFETNTGSMLHDGLIISVPGRPSVHVCVRGTFPTPKLCRPGPCPVFSRSEEQEGVGVGEGGCGFCVGRLLNLF